LSWPPISYPITDSWVRHSSPATGFAMIRLFSVNEGSRDLAHFWSAVLPKLCCFCQNVLCCSKYDILSELCLFSVVQNCSQHRWSVVTMYRWTFQASCCVVWQSLSVSLFLTQLRLYKAIRPPFIRTNSMGFKYGSCWFWWRFSSVLSRHPTFRGIRKYLVHILGSAAVPRAWSRGRAPPILVRRLGAKPRPYRNWKHFLVRIPCFAFPCMYWTNRALYNLYAAGIDWQFLNKKLYAQSDILVCWFNRQV